MPSERRLHPSAVLFQCAGQLKQIALPALVALFGASRSGGNWLLVLVVLLAATATYAVLQYIAFRYRLDANEIVIRSGVVFRKERHVPYSRIQNIDATQHLGHRLLGVMEVRVQTGGGDEPEAVFSALRSRELDDMRQRVREERPVPTPTNERAVSAPDQAAVGGDAEPAHVHADTLALSLRDLIITGLVELRGFAVIAAALGALWELGIERLLENLTGETRLLRRVLAWVRTDDALDPARLASAVGVVLVAIAALSVAWAVVRLYGFRVRRDGDSMHTEYGLLTRVTAAIPLRRIQSLTISEGPVHRLFGRITVEAETAGGVGGESATKHSRLAPLLRPTQLSALLDEVAPDLTLSTLTWQPLDVRAERRVFARSLLLICIPLAALSAFVLGWWSLALLLALGAVAAARARAYARGARWAINDRAVAFRHGWLWRRTTIARLAKLQVVTMTESPFDRRHAMAQVDVDTAGATVAIPFLPRETAMNLHAALATAAGQTQFLW